MFGGKAMRLGVVLASAAVLSGCVSSPPLSTLPLAGNNRLHDVRPAITEAERLQGIYAKRYEDLAANRGLLQLPLIGLAAAAATILIANPAGAASTIGYIGVGAGTYAAGTNALQPRGLAELYVGGHSGMECIRREAPLFLLNTGDLTGTPLGQMIDDSGTLAQLIAAGEALETADLGEDDPKDKTKSATREKAQAARSALSKQLVAARAAQAAARTDIGAGKTAGISFGSAVSAVATKVATKGLPQQLTFKEYLDAFAPAAPPAPLGAAGAGGDTTAERTASFVGATVSLQQAMERLAASSQPYATAIGRVEACAGRI